MQLKSGFELVKIADDHLAVPVGKEVDSFNGVVILSEASAFLLSQMKVPRTTDELVAILMREYDLNESTARTDLDAFVTQLSEMELIEA